MNRLNKTKSDIFISLMCSLLREDLHSELILFAHVHVKGFVEFNIKKNVTLALITDH